MGSMADTVGSERLKNPSDPADEPSGFSKRNGHRRVERIVRTEQERVTVTEHPLDDDAFKRHEHCEDAAAGRPDAGRVDAHESPLAHGGRKTVARYAEDAEFLPGIRLKNRTNN